jgi:hypothetical protein
MINDGAANCRGREGRQEKLGRFGTKANTGFKVVLIGKPWPNDEVVEGTARKTHGHGRILSTRWQ